VFAQKALIGAGEQQTIDFCTKIIPAWRCRVLRSACRYSARWLHRFSGSIGPMIRGEPAILTVPKSVGSIDRAMKADLPSTEKMPAGNGWFRIWWYENNV
jgi:hypothetical protein